MIDLMQTLPMIHSIARTIYSKPSYVKLRSMYELEDFQQSVWEKLLHRDNYMRYSEEYKLSSFIYTVCKSVAIQKMTKKYNEFVILDAPNADGLAMLDLVAAEELGVDPDMSVRISKILISLPEEVNPRVYLQFPDGEQDFSIENLFRLYLSCLASKEELCLKVINKSTSKPVTRQTFNKWYDKMVEVAQLELLA